MDEVIKTSSSNTDQSLKCAGTTKRGQPCKNAPLQGKNYCSLHLKRRRIGVTAVISVAIVLLGILADWIEVSNYFGIDFIKKSHQNLLSNEGFNLKREIPLNNAPVVIKQLSRITSTNELLRFLNMLVRKGDIAVGDHSDFEDHDKDALYVLVVDEKNVLDIFRYKNFVFYDIDSNYSCRELRTKYVNKRKIWLLHFSN